MCRDIFIQYFYNNVKEGETKFAKIFKQLRIENGYTQEEFSNALGVTRTAISNWENGKREPDIATLAKIADLFDVLVDELIYEKEIEVVDNEELGKEIEDKFNSLNKTIENYHKKQYKQDFIRTCIVFIITLINAVLIQHIFREIESIRILVYYIIIAPISYILTGVLCCFISKKILNGIIPSIVSFLIGCVVMEEVHNFGFFLWGVIYLTFYIFSFVITYLFMMRKKISRKEVKVLIISLIALVLLICFQLVLVSL